MPSVFTHIIWTWAALIVALPMLLITNLSGAVPSSRFLRQLHFSKVLMDVDYYWTLYNFCSRTVSGDITCTPKYAAYPYEPYLISSRINENRTFYYALRAAYGFLLGGLVLTFMANIFALVSVCWRSKGPYTAFKFFTWFSYLIALIGAALDTAMHVSGRNAFQGLGYNSSLGLAMMMFMWLGVGFLFFACLLLCCSSEPIYTDIPKDFNQNSPQPVYGMGYPPPQMANYQPYPQNFPMRDDYQDDYRGDYRRDYREDFGDEELYYSQPSQYRNNYR